MKYNHLKHQNHDTVKELLKEFLKQKQVMPEENGFYAISYCECAEALWELFEKEFEIGVAYHLMHNMILSGVLISERLEGGFYRIIILEK